MIRGLYSSASGMHASMRKQETLSNNLANIDTTGYKQGMQVQQSFREELMSRVDQESTPIGPSGSGTGISHTALDHSNGEYRETGNDLDWAIEGDGFFAVEAPQGVRYTRNGDFTINNQGQVVTQEGYLVRGEEGVLQVPPGSEEITVQNNDLLVDGIEMGTVEVVDFPERGGLEREGDSLFRWTPEAGEQIIGEGQVAQGFLEGSNVHPVEEMTKMIENSRKYQADQRMIQSHDETLQQATNQVGRV